MADTLNFSTGKEPRIYVEVSGWPAASKASFEEQAAEIRGVTEVRGAGGSIGYYVYFDTGLTSEDRVSAALSAIAGAILRQGRGEAREAAGIVPEMVTISPAPPEPAPTIPSSSWTGIASLPERVAAFKQLAPVALAAVDSLIVELDRPGDNGGPPLDERKEALAALRDLHAALGALLAAAENAESPWIDGEGLVASSVHFAKRAADKLKDDPMPFAVSGLLVAVFAALGVPGLGGWLGSATLRMQKKS
ncbi:hypothetical protein J2W22_000496 [Sphingomonas kyeonggiensis]|uniref:hypothetical protein n=1 Tax=Sphingomonas kyeonggiensis TaxID=1268553 RepID=UPI00278B48E6|nr:hypothetical protein [Sphingomonas kyeonggiensis]MDQ0248449.1 hypothetical protein [Sphingomonas kyeonggiensis]